MALYDLSDGLSKLSRDFDEFTHGGLVIDGETAHQLALKLKDFRDLALQMEFEVSRHRWNEPELKRQIEVARIAAEAKRPGSNVRLFPMIDRVIGDALPGGTA